MEKEPQPDSMATVTIKPDYPPSDYSSEPPPAYHKSQSSAVQVAKIIAVTVVLVSVVLGGFLLASAYVTANASCRQLEQELELLSEAADRFQAPLQPEALVQEEPQPSKHHAEALMGAKTDKPVAEIDNNNVDSTDSEASSSDASSESEDEDAKTPIHFKLPLQLDFDDLAGALIEKTQKSRMNCVVEKKRAEEVIDHQPKTIRLPFGLNLTTDPKYERVSGERMAIFCESGNMQRQGQQENEDEDDDEDDGGETIMIQPVMVPIPQTHFPTHMAQQMPPQQPQYQQIHPMEAMRPPMVAQPQPQNQLPPTSVLHHIAQQIIAQKIMNMQRAQEEQRNQEQVQHQYNAEQPRPEGMMAQRIPIPEEVLTQLNRLPNRDMVIAVSEQEPEEQQHQQQQVHMAPQEIRVVPQEMREIRPQQMHIVTQQQRENAHDMNGRQSYAREIPVHIPVHMIQQEAQEPQAAASDDARPHYVQPRSVRSVDALLAKSQKRVKRCSCDCAC